MSPCSHSRLARLIAFVGGAIMMISPQGTYSQTVPPGFVVENAFPLATFTKPVQIVFLPDGRKFVVEQNGRIWTITSGGTKLSTPFIDLTLKVNSNGDRGLLGVAIDPDFVSNRWVYILYTFDVDSNGSDDEVESYGRLERYQANISNPNVADLTTQQSLIGGNWSTGIPGNSLLRTHSIGALRFASDKTLLVSSGDGAGTDIDVGGAWPDQFGPGKTDPSEDIGVFRSQSLNSLCGKILRIDKETGDGLPSNPFWDGNPNSVRSRVWAYGLRNPYRFSIRPGSGNPDPTAGQPGVIYIGDVGWNTTEELSIATQGGMNFGWPCFEGPFARAEFQAVTSTNWPNANVLCSAPPSSENPSPKTPPVIWLDHQNQSNSYPVGLNGSAAMGGVFYTDTTYPAQYRGKYYFGEYAFGMILGVEVDTNDNVVSTFPFLDHYLHYLVDVESDPISGDLFYIDYNHNLVNRIRYVVGNRNPIVNATVDPLSGALPLSVTVHASGSIDVDGDSLRYVWDFGNGLTSQNPDTTITYDSAATYFLTITVTDGQGGNAIKPFQVVAGQVAPLANIANPIDSVFFSQNQIVQLDASTADTTAGLVTYRWDTDYGHNAHEHLSEEVLFGQQSSFSPASSNDGDRYYWRVRLEVSQGAVSSRDTVYIFPKLNVYPSSISFSPAAPTPGVTFTVNVKVRSVGEVGSSITKFSVYDDTTYLASGTLLPVLNGDSLTLSPVIGPLAEGSHFIRVVLDSANTLTETNELDNIIGDTVFIAKSAQTITFNPLPNKIFGDLPFLVSATASSGLPVAFAVLSGPASVTQGTITLSGVGTVTIRASQPGNIDYNPAPNVDRAFDVLPPTNVYVNPLGSDVSGNGSSGNPFKTIQKAIDVVAAGGTVHIDPGVASESIVLNKNVTFIGNTTVPLQNCTLTSAVTMILGSDAQVDGILTIGSGTLEVGPHTLIMNGPVSLTTGKITTDSLSSLNVGGASNSVSIPSSITSLNNLTITGSGTKTLTANLLLAGNLTITGGVLNMVSYSANRVIVGGTLQLDSLDTLIIAGNTGGLSGSNFPANFSSTLLNGTVSYDGSSPQTVAPLTYNNLMLTNNGSKTISSSLIVNGQLGIDQGTNLQVSSTGVLQVKGTLTNLGTLSSDGVVDIGN